MAEENRVICNTSFTIDWLRQALFRDCLNQEICPENNLISWEAKQIAVDKGFLSHIIRVSFKWRQNPDQKLPESVVLKVPTMQRMTEVGEGINETTSGEKNAAKDEPILPDGFLISAHSTECGFYDLMRAEREPLPFKIPRSYCAIAEENGNQGVIVMEDLSESGIYQDLVKGLSLKQAYLLAENLAGLHAWSLKNKGKWESVCSIPTREHLKNVPKMMRSILDNAKANQSHVFSPVIIDPLYDVLCDVDKSWYPVYSMHKEVDMPPVLCQGDLWINNIMWKKETDKDGSPIAEDELVAIIDWQLCHPGCAAEDFQRFLGTSCPTEIRRNHSKALLEFYYNKLREHLGGQEPPFSYEKLLQAFDKLQIYSMFGGLAPLMMAEVVSKGKVPKEDCDLLLYRARDLIEDTLPYVLSQQ